MKKLDKIDVFMFICLMLGCLFGLAIWITETIAGIVVLWLRVPFAILIAISIAPVLGWFYSDVISQISEYHKEKKNNKEKKDE